MLIGSECRNWSDQNTKQIGTIILLNFIALQLKELPQGVDTQKNVCYNTFRMLTATLNFRL